MKYFCNYQNFSAKPDEYSYAKFDLQLFAGEKTEDPTPKRQQETRNKGQVAKSQELNAVVILFAAFYILNILGSYIYGKIADYAYYIFSNLGTMHEYNAISVMIMFKDFSIFFFLVMLPVTGAVLIAALAVNYYQVGILFTTEILEPKLEKLDPIKGFGRLFSKQALVQLAKSIIKIIIVCYFIYYFALLKDIEISNLISVEIIDSMKIAGSLTMELAYKILLILTIIAVLDYIFQKWQHTQNIKMSKQEVKEEYKQTEGDPKIKSKIKQKQREMAMRRMMQEIPTATVVVTNPTHLAIALKYDKSLLAPMVVAKGKNFLAERIKEIAREHNVMIVENKPLARTLYPLVEVGEVIPPQLYQAVAEVLAYVYRIKKRPS